ncbi:hypothetical protein ACQJBY_067803 [Aegilops geniculata]
MQAWEIAHTRKDSKPGEPQYYGKHTAGKKQAYSEAYLKLHPDTPDPIAAPLDDRAVVSMGPKEHGREAVLDAVITPSISYTQLRRIDPSLTQRTSQPVTSTQSLFQEQQSAYLEYTCHETMAWHQRLYEHQVKRDSQMQQAFQDMASDKCPQFPPAQCPPAQPVLMSFEEFVAQNSGPSPVDLPLAVVFAALRRHGARPLRSTEAEAEVQAVLAVALPLAVTTWASAVLAVTTSVVLVVLALKPLGHIVAVLVVMILICL